MMPLLHRQPFKFIYLVYFAAKLLLVKIPFWVAVSLPRAGRPRPTWSIGRCVLVYLVRAIVPLPVTLGLEAKRDLSVEVPDSSLKDAKFVWVDGVAKDSLKGDVRAFADEAGVEPARIPGYWQLKKGAPLAWTPEAKDGETVVYHLHGGAFHLCSAHPADDTARIPRGILAASKSVDRTFAVDYRLSASAPFPAENPFPAALLDALAGYAYLVRMGFRPENIVLAGDSAGGNLALALARYLTEAHPAPAHPAAPGRLLLLSPWADLFSSRAGPASSRTTNMCSDMFPARPVATYPFCGYGARSYVGAARDPADPRAARYLSPAARELCAEAGLFRDFPRTYVLAGEAEMLLDDATAVAERIDADSGRGRGRDGWVTLDVAYGAIHDFCLFPWHEPERGDALARICHWIDND